MQIPEIIAESRRRFETLLSKKWSGGRLDNFEFRELWSLYFHQPEWISLIERVGIRCKNKCERCLDG